MRKYTACRKVLRNLPATPSLFFAVLFLFINEEPSQSCIHRGSNERRREHWSIQWSAPIIVNQHQWIRRSGKCHTLIKMRRHEVGFSLMTPLVGGVRAKAYPLTSEWRGYPMPVHVLTSGRLLNTLESPPVKHKKGAMLSTKRQWYPWNMQVPRHQSRHVNFTLQGAVI